MARIAQDPEVRRREILDAAEKLFEQKGFQRTTISDIAQAMNVAQGMLYYYFKSKEELLGDIVLLLQSPMQKLISALESGKNTIGGVLKTLEDRA